MDDVSRYNSQRSPLQRTPAMKKKREDVPHIIQRSASVPTLKLEPVIMEQETPSYCNDVIDGSLELVNELDPVQYKIETSLPQVNVLSPSSSEATPEKKCSYQTALANSQSVTDDREEVSSVGGYLPDKGSDSSDSEELSSTQLHSQAMLNELLFKFRRTRSRRKSYISRQRSSTGSIQSTKALDVIKSSYYSVSSNEELSDKESAVASSVTGKELIDEKIQVRKTKKVLRKPRTQSLLLDCESFPSPAELQKIRRDAHKDNKLQHILASPKRLHSPRFSKRDPEAVQKTVKKYKLHNPRNPEKLLKHLQSNKYDQVERDEHGDTPLHAIIRDSRRDKLECLITFMVHSDYGTENIDMPSLYGTTALHLAVQKADIEIVKLLLVFGANIDSLNDKGKTPLDLLLHKGNDPKFEKIITLLQKLDAKHGKEVLIIDNQNHNHSMKLLSISSHHPELQEKIDRKVSRVIEKPRALSNDALSPSVIAQQLETNLNDLYTEYDAIDNIDIQLAIGLQQFELQGWKITSSSAIKFQVKGGSRILILDGGGIRGLIQIEIMSLIEQRTGHRIIDLFDWIIGTSTGGVVALGLVYGKKSLAELRQVYFRMKEDIFAKAGLGFGYNTEALENILKDIFSTEMLMSHVQEPKVLISAVNKKTTNLQLNFFNNCFHDEFSHQPVWKVARYTSAAPMYFTECDDYVDGGVLANNPSDYGLTAIQNFHRQKGCKLDIACVVSIGTGTFPAENLGSTNLTSVLDTITKKASNLLTLLTKALVESEDVATNCRSRCEEQHIPFFRFCPRLDTEILPGETDINSLIDMLMTTKYQAVDEWADQLDDLTHIFSKIEEYSRKETISKLREKRRRRDTSMTVLAEDDNNVT